VLEKSESRCHSAARRLVPDGLCRAGQGGGVKAARQHIDWRLRRRVPSISCKSAAAGLQASGKIPGMRILALETAADPGSIALWLDGQVVARNCPAGLSNSATLLPLVEATLREAGCSLAELDGIAFGAGPGSFTGLRVACGVAQGLAMARDLPLLAIGTLEAMAQSTGGERVIVALDARMGEVYYGVFEQGVQQGEIAVLAPENVPLPATTGWLACGNGLTAYPALGQRLAPFVDTWQAAVMPSAEAVARLAAPRLALGLQVDPAAAVPFYVRDKVAKTISERLAQGGKA
jgi:tRNA threonylcarbamoyladenosine biosynthesis protein TsaB